jgi:maltooligosyltrehalose synthase
VAGAQAERLCAFARRHLDACVVVAAPRWPAENYAAEGLSLGSIWKDTDIAVPEPGSFENALTGEVLRTARSGERHLLPVQAVLANFPVAFLERRSS